jgi:hypothetical protein
MVTKAPIEDFSFFLAQLFPYEGEPLLSVFFLLWQFFSVIRLIPIIFLIFYSATRLLRKFIRFILFFTIPSAFPLSLVLTLCSTCLVLFYMCSSICTECQSINNFSSPCPGPVRYSHPQSCGMTLRKEEKISYLLYCR